MPKFDRDISVVCHFLFLFTFLRRFRRHRSHARKPTIIERSRPVRLYPLMQVLFASAGRWACEHPGGADGALVHRRYSSQRLRSSGVCRHRRILRSMFAPEAFHLARVSPLGNRRVHLPVGHVQCLDKRPVLTSAESMASGSSVWLWVHLPASGTTTRSFIAAAAFFVLVAAAC